MKAKRCTKCGKVKQVNKFYKYPKNPDGLRYWCKDCRLENNQQWRENHPEYHKTWRKKYEEHIQKYGRKWREEHSGYMLGWRNRNREYYQKYKREYMRQKRKENPQFCLGRSIAVAIWDALRSKKAGRHWEDLVNFTLGDLVKHLENQFTSNMTWDNYGDCWEVDHIIPKSWFEYEDPKDEAFKECWSLENLQPLGVSENRSKGNKFIGKT